MILAILSIIFIIVLISALLYILGCLVSKRMISRRKKYQEHIDDLVEELFPPSFYPAIPTPAVSTPTTYESYPQEDTVQYQEAKRKMVADIRKYFNQRKLDAAIRDTEIAIRDAEIKTGLPMNSPMFSSGPDTAPLPSSPSFQRILE